MPKEPNYRQIEKKILDDVLNPELYDPRIRPAGLNSTGESSRVEHSHWSRSVHILSSDWLDFNKSMLAPRSMP